MGLVPKRVEQPGFETEFTQRGLELRNFETEFTRRGLELRDLERAALKAAEDLLRAYREDNESNESTKQ